MHQRILGKTELSVSPLAIGTWQLAGPLTFDDKPDGHPAIPKKEALTLIKTLHDLGINHIDTAEQYGNGYAEQLVGEATSRQRDQWIISTKFGYRVTHDGRREDDSSPSTIQASIEGSLKRLKTDHLDILLYHCPPHPEDFPEAAEILTRLKKEGKVRFCGISTSHLSMCELLQQHGVLDLIQFPHNLLDPSFHISNFAQKHHLGTQVRGVMANGKLSGKYRNQKPQWKKDDNRSAWLKDEKIPHFRQLEPYLDEGEKLSQLMIRWALSQAHHHTICLGAKNLQNYQEAIAAASRPALSRSLCNILEKITASKKSPL